MVLSLASAGFLTCMLLSVLSWKFQGILSSLWSSLAAQPSPLNFTSPRPYPHPRLCPTSTSPNSNSCLLNSVESAWLCLVPFSLLWPGNSLQAVNWGHQRHDFICFASLEAHALCCLWSSVWQPSFMCFVWFFSCLRWERKLYLLFCYSCGPHHGDFSLLWLFFLTY